MPKAALFLLAVALAACAATPRSPTAVTEAELPRLVAACNGAFRDGSEKGLETVTIRIATVTEGLEACDRLALAGSLDQVRPATAEIYQRYRAAMTSCLANSSIISATGGISTSTSCPEQATMAITKWVAATRLLPQGPGDSL
jgi:hypothetical protein